MNFELHATAALPPGEKIFRCQLDRMLGGPFPGMEARFLGRPVRSPFSVPSALCRLLRIIETKNT